VVFRSRHERVRALFALHIGFEEAIDTQVAPVAARQARPSQRPSTRTARVGAVCHTIHVPRAVARLLPLCLFCRRRHVIVALFRLAVRESRL